MAFHVSLSVEANFSVDSPLYVRVTIVGGLSVVGVGEEGGLFLLLAFFRRSKTVFLS